LFYSPHSGGRSCQFQRDRRDLPQVRPNSNVWALAAPGIVRLSHGWHSRERPMNAAGFAWCSWTGTLRSVPLCSAFPGQVAGIRFPGR